MLNEIDNHINNIYECQTIFISKLYEILYKLTNIKFYCNINKKNILNLTLYYFEEILDDKSFIFLNCNYHDLICSNIDNITDLNNFINNMHLDNKKYIIKYDIINDKWSLLLCNMNDNYCYILINFKPIDILINYFSNKNKKISNEYSNKYAIVPYINIIDHIKNKEYNEMNNLINKLDKLTINKSVKKNILKR